MSSLFSVDNVTFHSRTNPVVKGISLDIQRGSITALVGKSGCGKSTLLKLISGILVPSSGKVLYEGKDIQTMNRHENLAFRKNCSYVFQDSALWANQDIMSNLSLPLLTHFPEMSAEDRKFAVDSICAMVNFDKPLSLRPSDLSMGEQKKIAFARAMVTGPEVLFLDECTESLDRKATAIIIDLLHNFVQQGNTIIYVSHSSSFINEFKGDMHTLEGGLLSDSVFTGE